MPNHLVPIAFELPHITLRGLTNNLTHKPLIVALHGWLDNAASFIPLLTEVTDYHIIALDWAGHGLSDHRPPGTDYQQFDYIDDLHQLLTEQKWENVILMGHSMGGILSSIYAATFPEMVRAVVSIDAMGPITTESSVAENLRTGVLSRHQRRAKRSIASPVPLTQLIDKRQQHTELSGELVELLIKRATRPVIVEAGDGGTQVVWRTDSRLRNASLIRLTEQQAQELMTELSCPMQIIIADDGLLAKRGLWQQREQWFGSAEIVHLTGGHHLHMYNTEQIWAPIAAFLHNIST
ncbi:alpha/beta hydrolase [Alteromonas sp. ASW11-36]|uniref:Alpha/beta hydrolase n=1 Tax=Alteromonas arenosi TaxID=3055817 RepID=A0ABT7SVR4_9ALTE|nr:alpha/beta hydrolase [Alteromonas sp. ASW11-36]MDM7860287.1 alpha/beta hydrolase [Alteromonas sp. ASW11-36]